jgi:hypothetical protein
MNLETLIKINIGETKMLKRTFTVIAILLLLFSLNLSSYSQTQSMQIVANNLQQTSPNTMTFDLRFVNTSGGTLQIASWQFYWDFNQTILNGGTGSFTILNTYCPANVAPRNPAVQTTFNPYRLALGAATPPGAGNGWYINNGQDVAIMKLQLSTSVAEFFPANPLIVFRQNTGAITRVQVNAYIGTTNTNITPTGNTNVQYFNIPNTPMPVELLSFTSNVTSRDVHLTWKTAKEQNNKGFDIERKAFSDKNWNKVGFVEGNGNTNTQTTYNYDDKKLNTGKYSYRLKQVDYNGNYEYFTLNNSVEVGVPSKFDLSQNYPNPFNPVTNIEYSVPFDSKITVKIYDNLGREISTLVNESQVAGYYTVQFNAASLSSGVYFYRIFATGNGNNFVMTKKMSLIK